MSRILFLVRHGRSDFDSAQMSAMPRGDQWDPPLSDEGREQAGALARRLVRMDVRPAAIHCSPLRRARETAAPYAELAGLEVRYEEALIEAHIGGWEGLPFEEIVASDAEVAHRVLNQQAIWHRAPGGERMPEFRDRVVGAVERILADEPGDVVVIAHGGVINAYCGQAIGLPQEMFFLPENTSINSIVVDGDRRTVRFLNDVAHLTDPQLFEGPEALAYTASDPEEDPET